MVIGKLICNELNSLSGMRSRRKDTESLVSTYNQSYSNSSITNIQYITLNTGPTTKCHEVNNLNTED